jgi:hypothetical protein
VNRWHRPSTAGGQGQQLALQSRGGHLPLRGGAARLPRCDDAHPPTAHAGIARPPPCTRAQSRTRSLDPSRHSLRQLLAARQVKVRSPPGGGGSTTERHHERHHATATVQPAAQARRRPRPHREQRRSLRASASTAALLRRGHGAAVCRSVSECERRINLGSCGCPAADCRRSDCRHRPDWDLLSPQWPCLCKLCNARDILSRCWLVSHSRARLSP